MENKPDISNFVQHIILPSASDHADQANNLTHAKFSSQGFPHAYLICLLKKPTRFQRWPWRRCCWVFSAKINIISKCVEFDYFPKWSDFTFEVFFALGWICDIRLMSRFHKSMEVKNMETFVDTPNTSSEISLNPIWV